MALLHVLAGLRKAIGFRFCAHGVNHGLREAARMELDLARKLADRLGVPFGETKVFVDGSRNVQARAREARYAALERCREEMKYDFIATAHHADDRAETVLLRLLRGAGPRGLAVLPPREGTRVRPMIRALRADVLAHLERHNIDWADDPSNEDPRFTRTRVRREVMPLLHELSPGIVNHLTALADQVSAEPVAVQDMNGDTVPLKRAHIEALRHAERCGIKGFRIRLSGGRVLCLDSSTHKPIVRHEIKP